MATGLGALEVVPESRETASGGMIRIPAGNSDYTYSTTHQPDKGVPERVQQAVGRIEQWWIRVRGRKIFNMLKEAICAAEHSLTYEVLRKLNPLEAELLKDPALKARIKFRFGGTQFPPLILFKIFTSTQSAGHGGVCYFSGKRMIKPASEAAEDAKQQMGNRIFYDQLFQDVCHHEQLRITDEMDVTTMKEYMQYVANMDETPAHLGGKENTWRRLNLDALPRHSFLHNLVEFLEQRGQRKESIQRLQSLTRPQSEAHISKTVSSLSHRKVPPTASSSSKEGGRRSRQAQKRVEKMRKLYRMSEEESLPDDAAAKKETEDDWEQEADDLFQWTQELSFEDVT